MRVMIGGPHLRVIRSAVFSGLAVALSAGLRQAVTGDAVPVMAVLAGFAAVFAVALLLSSGERRFASIAALLIPLELLLNALLNTSRHGCTPGLGDLVCGGSLRPSGGEQGFVALTGGQVAVLMLVNLVATLLIAWWLWRGEIAVFVLVQVAALLLWRGCSALLAWLTAVPAVPERPWACPPDGPPPARGPQEILRAATRRRGPPVLLPA